MRKIAGASAGRSFGKKTLLSPSFSGPECRSLGSSASVDVKKEMGRHISGTPIYSPEDVSLKNWDIR